MRRTLALLLLAMAAPIASAADKVVRASELKAEPFSDAATVATLAANSNVTVLAREGGWYRVTSQGREGWVRLFNIRRGDSAGGSSGLGEAAEFISTGRSGSSGVTVATGIRGLDAADVTRARPDYAALERTAGFSVDKVAAQRFARRAGLSSREIAYGVMKGGRSKGTEQAIPGVDW